MPLGSIVTGLIGAGGANAAGGAAAAAGQQSLNSAEDWAKTLRAWSSPWIATGQGAESQLSALYGLGSLVPTGDTYGDYTTDTANAKQDQANALAGFKTSPGYQFRLQQGVNALDRSASAKGMNLSGAQTKALSDYGQNTADSEWGNYINELNGLAGGGLSATTSSGQQGTSTVNEGINALTMGNMARASSYSNAANALANGIGGGINSLAGLAGFYGMGGFGGGTPYSLTGGGSNALAQAAVNQYGTVPYSGV